MVKMSFIPEGKSSQFYTPVEVQFNFPNDASLDDYFRAFQSFCYALGFGSMDNYELEYIQDNGPNEYENCGEILTEKDKEMFKSFKIGEKFEMIQTEIPIINDKPKGDDNDSTT
jgi:hypothetical protein